MKFGKFIAIVKLQLIVIKYVGYAAASVEQALLLGNAFKIVELIGPRFVFPGAVRIPAVGNVRLFIDKSVFFAVSSAGIISSGLAGSCARVEVSALAVSSAGVISS